MKSLIALTAIGLLILSCQKENLNKKDGISYPLGDQPMDFNGDGQADFTLRYVDNSDMPELSTGPYIEGRIIERGSNLILPRSEDKTLTLSKGDTIKRPGELISLQQPSNILVYRGWNGKRWEENWTINSDNDDSAYYLGYILDWDSGGKIGWAQLAINPESARISIIAFEETSADFIVID